MARGVILAILGSLLLVIGPAHGSPVRGHHREARLHELERRTLESGQPYVFNDIFNANERACIIVEGDHKEAVNLTIRVFDFATNDLIAMDSGGDCVAVFWYPQRTDRFRVSITSDSKSAIELDIVVK